MAPVLLDTNYEAGEYINIFIAYFILYKVSLLSSRVIILAVFRLRSVEVTFAV